MGASFARISGLLSNAFFRLVLLAAVIAFPVGWSLMNQWLQGFAYRTTTSWQAFAVSELYVMSIASLTVGYQAIKAALANP